jgi:hypothetical protein
VLYYLLLANKKYGLTNNISLVLIIPEPKSIFKVPLPLLTSSPPLILPEDKVVLIKSCILLYVTTPKDFTGIVEVIPVKLNVP